MNRIALISFICFLVFYTTRTDAGPPEVRFDLVLVESFDGAAFTYSEPVEIGVNRAEASSSLSDRYGPSNLIDDDTGSAWIEGVQGYGIDESVRLFVSAIPRVIGIWPGFQRNSEIFFRNGRPASIRVAFVGDDTGRGDTNYDIFSYSVDLFRGYEGKIAMQPQFIYISGGDILHNMALSEFAYIEIQILSVDSSDAIDPDMGISEIRLYAEGSVVGVRVIGD